MSQELTGPEARRLRTRNNWSLQYLANRSGINKAYLSEFEHGHRTLAQEQVDLLRRLLNDETAGHATPRLIVENNHHRLIFIDPDTEKVKSRPPVAHIRWTDESGTTYTMYVGEPEA